MLRKVGVSVAMHGLMSCTDFNVLQVYIDGPYSSVSTHIFQAEHAVLIGAGIGVTPFASILQSVVMRYDYTDGSRLLNEEGSMAFFASLIPRLTHTPALL